MCRQTRQEQCLLTRERDSACIGNARRRTACRLSPLSSRVDTRSLTALSVTSAAQVFFFHDRHSFPHLVSGPASSAGPLSAFVIRVGHHVALHVRPGQYACGLAFQHGSRLSSTEIAWAHLRTSGVRQQLPQKRQIAVVGSGQRQHPWWEIFEVVTRRAREEADQSRIGLSFWCSGLYCCVFPTKPGRGRLHRHMGGGHANNVASIWCASQAIIREPSPALTPARLARTGTCENGWPRPWRIIAVGALPSSHHVTSAGVVFI